MRNPNWQAMKELQTLRRPRLTVGAAFVNQFLVFGCFFFPLWAEVRDSRFVCVLPQIVSH